jgi:hypothetical protein
VCSLHCAVKSVTFSVYNDTDLNFNIRYSVVIAIIANCIENSLRNVSFVGHRNVVFSCVLVYRRGKMSVGQNVKEVL